MGYIRIGEKLISPERITRLISEILMRRSRGETQMEVAESLGIERSFVSHLEGLGEIRRGRRVALVGFPIENKEEVEKVARECGVDAVYLFSRRERFGLKKGKSSRELFDEVLDILAELKDFDLIVLLAFSRRISKIKKILDREIVGISLGHVPVRKNKYVEPGELREVLAGLIVEEGVKNERSGKRKSGLLKTKS